MKTPGKQAAAAGRRPGRLTLLLVISWLGLLPQDSFGRGRVNAPARESIEERVRLLLETGAAALQNRDFPAARRALSEAYRSQPSPQILCELGAIAAAQAQLLEAQDLFRRCLAENSPENPVPAERVKEAGLLLQKPRPPAGEVLVFGPRGARVLVDDRLVGVIPLAMPLLLPVGNHLIMVQSEGSQLRGPVTVPRGRTVELQFSKEGRAILSRLLPALLLFTDYSAIPIPQAALLTQAAERTVQNEHWALFSVPDALSLTPALGACLTRQRCPSELAAPLGIEYVALARLTAPAGGERSPWTLRLALFDTEMGDVALSLERSCTSCNGERSAAMLAEALTQLIVQGPARPRGVLAIESVPTGAEVRLNDRVEGLTPFRRPVFIGSHSVLLRKDGYESARSTPTVTRGKTMTVALTLSPRAPSLPNQTDSASTASSQEHSVRAPRPRWRIVVGSLAVLAGSLSIGFGASALAVRGSCIMPVNVGECPDFYGTTAVGGSLLGVGTLLLLPGAVLLALPGPKP